ncbi:hypothetical protein GA0111570_10114 [Raineyella antarctica]|uniref:Peptidase propeptide and YPEB domain-containing protein n=1 Tax=Raineyella antarctica TaxID=1577474 RepID=A0A1G6GDC7_9ACTN|nr:hypothetical protein [Raineyella antarctica]SDB79745.1 hypothetical protein GA0111570_10114 [Raineyella antarctica]
MTRKRLSKAGPRWLAWVVLAVAGLLLVASVAFVAWGFGRPPAPVGGVAPQWSGHGAPMTGPGGRGQVGGPSGGMMGGRVWLAGDGVRVGTIAQARARATQAAASSGLRPGEVMQFTNNFYVELKDTSGAPTTEVLVDPATGAVATEYGPAMMWNTGNRTATVSADQAVAIANRWLPTNAAGQTAATPEAYPGYYTIDTTSGGKKVGMLSVNATTGAVWYHTWHGQFLAEEDA